MVIKISKTLELPNDAVTQTFAQIGKKGAGKTYLASMIAEQMLDIEAQVIVIDPIGNWWGLRVDEDGKSKGKNIFIIGGRHGDIPLAAEAGKEIAKLLTEKNISVVLDISEFRKNERKRFVTDFAEEFYHLKKSKAYPVHIFLEEAQKFVPQRVQKDEARMLGAWEDIVRLGRNCGIGCSLISQRPQSVNKEVLSQVECLCVLQVTGLHERKALEEWIQEAGESRKLIGELPGLYQGQGYVWSPSWLRVFEKVDFAKKTTFDTSKTPELGKAIKAAKISSMDIKKLKEQMTTVVEKVKKENLDKKLLIEEIRELKTKLTIAEKHKIVEQKITEKLVNITDDKALQRAKDEGFKEAERFYKSYINPIEQNTKKLRGSILRLVKNSQNLLESKAFTIVGDFPIYSPTPVKVKSNIHTDGNRGFKSHQDASSVEKRFISPSKVGRDSTSLAPVGVVRGDSQPQNINAGAMRMLKAAAMFYPNEVSRAKIGAIAGMSYKSGTFNTYLTTLKRESLIVGQGNSFSITDNGLEVAGDVEQIPTDPEGLVSLWEGIVKGGASRMLRVLFDNYPNSLSREELGDYAEISSTSGTFSTYLTTLKRNGLIKVEGQEIKISEEFF